MQLPVLLDRSRPDSLTSQLAEQLRDAIRRNRIAGGTRLPSSRQLSEQLSISRNTVVRAYDALVAEGFRRFSPGVRDFRLQAAAGQPAAAAGAGLSCRGGRDGRLRSDARSHAHDPGAEPAQSEPQPPFVRLLSRTAERRPVSSEDLAPVAATEPLPGRRGRPRALRRPFRPDRAAIRDSGPSGGDARRRRRSQRHRHRQAESRKASISRRACFSARARSGWSKRRATRARPTRSRRPARASSACRSTRRACRRRRCPNAPPDCSI